MRACVRARAWAHMCMYVCDKPNTDTLRQLRVLSTKLDSTHLCVCVCVGGGGGGCEWVRGRAYVRRRTCACMCLINLILTDILRRLRVLSTKLDSAHLCVNVSVRACVRARTCLGAHTRVCV